MTHLLWCPVFSTMHGFSLMFRVATLFLALCLQLGINKAQESTEVARPIILDLKAPISAKKNEVVAVELRIQNQYNECSVIKAYLDSDKEMEGAFNYKQTRCVCKDNPVTLFWDFEVTETMTYRVFVDYVRDKNICPNDRAVIPISSNRYFSYFTIMVS